jgi:hypothetical protein
MIISLSEPDFQLVISQWLYRESREQSRKGIIDGKIWVGLRLLSKLRPRATTSDEDLCIS